MPFVPSGADFIACHFLIIFSLGLGDRELVSCKKCLDNNNNTSLHPSGTVEEQSG